jgi:hypothetical protein
MNSGQLAAMAIGSTRIGILTPDSYKIAFAAQWAFPCAILLFALILPESPWYLIRKNKYKAAEANIQKLYAKSPAMTKGYMEFLKGTIEQERQLRSTENAPGYSSCFKSTDFRRTRIACGMFLVQQFAGIALYSQSLYFLGICGLDVQLTFKLAVASFGVALLGNMLSWILMSYIGMSHFLHRLSS